MNTELFMINFVENTTLLHLNLNMYLTRPALLRVGIIRIRQRWNTWVVSITLLPEAAQHFHIDITTQHDCLKL